MAERDNATEREKNRFTRRSLFMAAAQVTGFSLIGWRLFDIQVLKGGRYAPLADENRISLQVLMPRRGRILDAAGQPLADNEETFRATITPALATDTRAVLAGLRQILPLSDDDVSDIIRRTRKQSRSTPAIVATDLTFEQIARLNLFAPSLPGIATEPTSRRRYHGGPACGHVVGFVGNVERLGVNDDAILRLPEMRVGKCGAEAGFDTLLRGSGGTAKVEVDARGRIVRNLETVEPVAGRDVTLSIDTGLQQSVFTRAERERLAAAVVLDIATGEIAASVSVPSYDPSNIAGGISVPDWQALTASPDDPLLDRVISGQYAPASSFKLVTALAALDAKVITPDDRISCPGHYEFDGQSYPCWKATGHGDLTIVDAMRTSCDVFFYEIARRAGIEKIADAARRLGLGAPCNAGLANEKSGVIPDPDWKRGNFNIPWPENETLLAGIGTGDVKATPLQLALMTARIAGGRSLSATIEKRDAQAGARHEFATLAFDSSHLAIVRQGMIAAANAADGVAATKEFAAAVPRIAGMTDAPANESSNLEFSKRSDAVFIAYAPADTPRYAIAAIVEHGGTGNPAAERLARDILNLVRDHEEKTRAEQKPNHKKAAALLSQANEREG